MFRRDNRLELDLEVDFVERGGNVERRERVLAYPDLAQKLTEPPLRLRDPADWSGWVPPRTAPEEVCGPQCGRNYRCRGAHLAAANDSPIRAQLVAIAIEAMRRDEAAAAAHQQPIPDEMEEA